MASRGLNRFRDVEGGSRCCSFVQKAARHDRQPRFRFGLMTRTRKDPSVDRNGGDYWILDEKNLQTIGKYLTVDIERPPDPASGVFIALILTCVRLNRIHPERDTRLCGSKARSTSRTRTRHLPVSRD